MAAKVEGGEGVERLSKNEKGLMGMDYSVGIVTWGWGIKELNDNEKIQ